MKLNWNWLNFYRLKTNLVSCWNLNSEKSEWFESKIEFHVNLKKVWTNLPIDSNLLFCFSLVILTQTVPLINHIWYVAIHQFPFISFQFLHFLRKTNKKTHMKNRQKNQFGSFFLLFSLNSALSKVTTTIFAHFVFISVYSTHILHICLCYLYIYNINTLCQFFCWAVFQNF